MIQPNGVVAVLSDDSFNPYYLIKTMTEAVEIDVPFTDDYGHTFPIGHTIVKGHYLEVFKRSKNTTYSDHDQDCICFIILHCRNCTILTNLLNYMKSIEKLMKFCWAQ